MSITFSPAIHPSEVSETEDLYMNLHNINARTFISTVLGMEWDECGRVIPTDVLIREDELLLMASALDAMDGEQIIDGYWSFRLGEFLDVARWADRKGRDILWG